MRVLLLVLGDETVTPRGRQKIEARPEVKTSSEFGTLMCRLDIWRGEADERLVEVENAAVSPTTTRKSSETTL